MGVASTIAVSGLNVASLRLQVAAGNVANALSSGPLPGAANPEGFPSAYTPLRVSQVESPGGGTGATVTEVSPAYIETYDPSAPFASERGMVASPNVDITNELVQTLMARLSYAANAKVIRADAQMSAVLFDISA
jgi:flagellar basal-body rod protein FlgC